VRLLLRKPGRWHTDASMTTFTKEVGEEGLHRALVDLCLPFTALFKTEEMETEPESEPEISVKEEPEIIDLTFDYDNEEEQKWFVNNTEAGPSRLDIKPISETSYFDTKPGLDDISNHFDLDTSDPVIDFFCRDQTAMTLHEVLNRLDTEELKDLVKSTKVRPRKMVVCILAFVIYILIYHLLQKTEMVSALMSHASTQSILNFTPERQIVKGKQKVRDDGLHQTRLPFVPLSSKGKGKAVQQTQERRLMEMALKKLGKFSCIMRLNSYGPYFQVHA
jgi:fanconi-associated nuclease 1